jgi:hemoglobin
MHCGNGDIDDLGRRFNACFVQALDDADLPADPEFRQCMKAYMDWAVADVLHYSPEDAVVPAGIGVPRWSWDGLQEPA